MLPDIMSWSAVFSLPSLECHHHEGRRFSSFAYCSIPGAPPDIAEELSEVREQGVIGWDVWKDSGDRHKVALDKEAGP